MAHPTTLAAWAELTALARTIGQSPMRDLFARDKARFERFSLRLDPLLLDYSKNRIDATVSAALVRLAEQAGLVQARDAMFAGEKINATERRAVLHTALRNRSARPVMVDGADVMPLVQEVLGRMKA
ncbi:MAG: glucose-6-phosphate isomerase, partial [Magnetospirillum sp.]|nr:glucose-6-phosphate isomerase [Magnetospirillum sp.]